ncbi:Sodium/hydrogen exchanger family protein [uncultured archaeon]|nr:Sodium/hydrogen exchanger family protein [uncultured archaeon]
MLEILFLIGIVILIGFASRWIFEKTRIPEVIILLLAGFALGPLGMIKYFAISDIPQYFQGIAPVIGAVAIISIVFEAGLRLKARELQVNIASSVLSALLNIAACILVLSGILHFALGWMPMDSLVFGAIFGGMSSFAAYSTLPLIRTTNSIRNSLYLEGTLSAIAVCIVSIALMRYNGLAAGKGLAELAGGVFSLFSISFILGLGLGAVLLFALLNFKIDRFGFFLVFAALLTIYSIDFVYLGGIGVISIALIGFVLANSEEFLRILKKQGSFEVDESFRVFQGELSLFINTFFFVYLGLIFRPEQLNLQNVLTAILLVAGILLARIAVIGIMGRISKPQRHEDFLRAVMVPRDLLSATLATFIFIYPNSASFGIELVCLVVVLSTIANSAGLNYYERIFRDTFLFKKEILLMDGRKAVIRSFTRDDFGKLMRLFNELVEEGAYIAIDKRVSAAEEREIDNESIIKMNKKEMIVWVAEHDNKIVARAVAEKMPRRERDNVSLSFYIAKEFRGAGLGTILIRMIIKESIKQFNPHNLYLTVYSDNKKAIKLYEREGFIKCGVLPGWMRHNNAYLDRIYMVYDPKKQGKRKK